MSHQHLFPNGYNRPLESMSRYLDELDKHEATEPRMRCLTALGRKMIEMACARSIGVHPYSVLVSRTSGARKALGEGPLLAPEQTVVVDDDPHDRDVDGAQLYRPPYGQIRELSNSWLRCGFTEADFEDGGSDCLVNGIVAAGDAAAVVTRTTEHLDSKADYVCAQSWTGGKDEDRRPGWIKLARSIVATRPVPPIVNVHRRQVRSRRNDGRSSGGMSSRMALTGENGVSHD